MEVKLRENPSTGFRWLVLDSLLEKNNMQDIVKESNASFERDENRRGAVGVGGTRTLRFEFLQEGEGDIELFHARPWEVEKMLQAEEEEAPGMKKIVRVKVLPAQ